MCAITFAKPPKHHHATRNQPAAHTLTIVLLLLSMAGLEPNLKSHHTSRELITINMTRKILIKTKPTVPK